MKKWAYFADETERKFMMNRNILSARRLILGLLLAAAPWGVRAQVEKQVEVTKAYVPSVEPAEKLRIEPRMDDTVTMRPDIDYTVTPLTMQTNLETRPIRPAQISYWEFNTPSRFYLKAAAGPAPESLLDFYASTAHANTGYLMGYLNHEGRYQKLTNDFGVDHNANRMSNRIGAAAGKYFGPRLLEGDIHYRHRLDRRYGFHLLSDVDFDLPGERIGYSDADAVVRFGDDFQNLTRTNFELLAAGSLFFDHSDPMAGMRRGSQYDFGARARIGRAFSGHRFTLTLGYDRMQGARGLSDYNRGLLHAAARYAKNFTHWRVEAGADFYNDRAKNLYAGSQSSNYIFPYARLEYDRGAGRIKPFIEVDGSLTGNDFRSLTELNPYVGGNTWLAKSTADYNLRGGLTGHSSNNLFNYRLYGAFQVSENHLYWTIPAIDYTHPEEFAAGFLHPLQARQASLTVGGEATWHPLTTLTIDLAAHYHLYDDQNGLEGGDPSFDAEAGFHYDGRRIRFGVRGVMQSKRTWSVHSFDRRQTDISPVTNYTVPFECDLQANFEWMVSSSLALFVEGRNLLCRDFYVWPLFPDSGLTLLLGVRWNF